MVLIYPNQKIYTITLNGFLSMFSLSSVIEWNRKELKVIFEVEIVIVNKIYIIIISLASIGKY